MKLAHDYFGSPLLYFTLRLVNREAVEGRGWEWREEKSIVREYDSRHKGGDREPVGGRGWEWREERSIVREYDRRHKGGDRKAVGGKGVGMERGEKHCWGV